MADDPYVVLGVEPGADMAQLRRAYLAQLRRHHPDLRPGDAASEQRTRELNHAWEQIRRRRQTAQATATARSRAPQRPARGPSAAYSRDQQDFRAAFTSATLRVALAVFALSLVLLVALGR